MKFQHLYLQQSLLGTIVMTSSGTGKLALLKGETILKLS
jgi:hypothetical protein